MAKFIKLNRYLMTPRDRKHDTQEIYVDAESIAIISPPFGEFGTSIEIKNCMYPFFVKESVEEVMRLINE